MPRHGRIWRIQLNTPAPPKPTAAQQAAARQNLGIRKGKFPKTPVETLLKQAQSEDANTRFLAVLQLGKHEHARKANVLANALVQDANEKWLRAAVFNSLSKGESATVLEVMGTKTLRVNGVVRQDFRTALKDLGMVAAQDCTPDQLIHFWNLGMQHASAPFAKKHVQFTVWERGAFLNGLIAGAKKKGGKLTATHPDAHPLRNLIPLKSKLTPEELKEKYERRALPVDVVADISIRSTLISAKNSVWAGLSLPRRFTAMELLGHTDFGFAGDTLLRLLTPRLELVDIGLRTPDIQSAAVQALGNLNDVRVGQALLEPEAWESFTPMVRESVLGIVTRSTLHHPALIDALEKGTVPVHALSPARRKALERNKAIGARAKKLFAKHAGGDRMKAYEAAKPVLKMKADAANGAKMFTRACALCHTHSGQGHAVGPDLTGLRNQPAATLLMHIIVPNHEVQGAYTLYEVDTKDNQTFAGLLAADTPEQITLKLPLGITKTLPRKNIKTLRASPKSLMPEQLEKTMTKQELADLLAFLKK